MYKIPQLYMQLWAVHSSFHSQRTKMYFYITFTCMTPPGHKATVLYILYQGLHLIVVDLTSTN